LKLFSTVLHSKRVEKINICFAEAVAEMGYKDFETSQWYGVLVPAGTPSELVVQIQEECLRALKSSSVTERFATDNAVGGGGSPAEFAAYIAKEQKIWSRIVKEAHIRPD
jgi:tripartite-type tricarboxylate transporter receptor subunit TctC